MCFGMIPKTYSTVEFYTPATGPLPRRRRCIFSVAVLHRFFYGTQHGGEPPANGQASPCGR